MWADAKPTAPWDYRKGNVPDADANIVFVTDKGKKYHRTGCKSLAKSSNPISLADALKGIAINSVSKVTS
ncbi:MAG: hypothetical protein K8T89_22065 [Planctomycetes bacterium]|nr:hypothetical protein [Planctomycetota bacterium]